MKCEPEVQSLEDIILKESQIKKEAFVFIKMTVKRGFIFSDGSGGFRDYISRAVKHFLRNGKRVQARFPVNVFKADIKTKVYRTLADAFIKQPACYTENNFVLIIVIIIFQIPVYCTKRGFFIDVPACTGT